MGRGTLGLALWFLAGWTHAAVQASLDQEHAHLGATVVLTILAEDLRSGETPDLAPLTADFEISNSIDGGYLRIQQGKLISISQWTIYLRPRRQGTLGIPPLSVGEYLTPALSLTVSPERSSTGAQPSAFLEVQINPQTPYALSEFNLTVQLFHSARLLQGALEDPLIEGVDMRRLRNNVVGEATRHGQHYRVLESHYAIFPEISGEITIPAVAFRGRAAYAGEEIPVSRLPGLANPLQVRSQPQTLRILPPPARFSGEYWLAARSLRLTAHWPTLTEPLQPGDPVVVNLITEAQGLRHFQLPELPLPTLADVRLYRELQLSEDRDDGTWITAHREETLTLIPTRGGTIQFPEISLSWWDTTLHREQRATLAGQRIMVSGEAPSLHQRSTDGLSLLLLAGGLGLIVHGLSRRWRRSAPRRRLRRACGQDNPLATAVALRIWGRWLWPALPPRSLGEIAHRLNLAGPLAELDRALYRRGTTHWRGRSLWRAVAGLRPGQRRGQRSSPLASLYPNRRTPPRSPPW